MTHSKLSRWVTRSAFALIACAAFAMVSAEQAQAQYYGGRGGSFGRGSGLSISIGNGGFNRGFSGGGYGGGYSRSYGGGYGGGYSRGYSNYGGGYRYSPQRSYYRGGGGYGGGYSRGGSYYGRRY